VRAGVLRSAHDVSDGGLLAALLECGFGERRGGELGCRVDLGVPDDAPARDDVALFSESQARAVVTVREGTENQLLAAAAVKGVPARVAGTVGGERCVVTRDGGGREVVSLDVAALRGEWETVLPRLARGE